MAEKNVNSFGGYLESVHGALGEGSQVEPGSEAASSGSSDPSIFLRTVQSGGAGVIGVKGGQSVAPPDMLADLVVSYLTVHGPQPVSFLLKTGLLKVEDISPTLGRLRERGLISLQDVPGQEQTLSLVGAHSGASVSEGGPAERPPDSSRS